MRVRRKSQKKRVGLIGSHPQFSLSPAIHNRAFAALNLPWHYENIVVARGSDQELVEAISLLRGGEFAGANVTVPHKRSFFPYVDELTEAADAIGAINTIRVEADGRLSGHNTDAEGFSLSLKRRGIPIKGKRALVFGAGGAARAVLYALQNEGIAEVIVVNRSVGRAVDVVRALFPEGGPKVTCLPLAEFSDWFSSKNPTDLVINTTPLGSQTMVDGSPWPSQLSIGSEQQFIDLIYNPSPTLFLRQARDSGAVVVDGLGMLVEQAALSFTFWTGEKAPIKRMFQAAEEGLCLGD